jgi:hypothetical protein
MSAIIPFSANEHIQLTPQSIVGNIATYMDTSTDVAVAFPKLTASLTRPSKNSKNSRVRLRYSLPTLETAVVGVPPKAAYENYVDITFTFNERSTSAERTIFKGDIMAILAEATIDELIVDLNMLY